jgi:hypothetical protein
MIIITLKAAVPERNHNQDELKTVWEKEESNYFWCWSNRASV